MRTRQPFSHLCAWCRNELPYQQYPNRSAYCNDRCQEAMVNATKTIRLGRREIDALRPKPRCHSCGKLVDRLGTVYIDFKRSTVHLPGTIGWASCSACIELRRVEKKRADYQALEGVRPY